jgi:uncharacterized protein involved in type VI secretion and phage assembly
MDIFFPQRAGPADADIRFYGVVIALVTNNNDPDDLGRVKLRLPWLDDESESDWARVMTPMAGAGRGFYFLPEVDDEVLVAFEHGSPESPYVLGALWNGKDKPPESNQDGKNQVRMIKSRSGHVIRLTDKDGEEQIEIVDGSAKNSIVIRTSDNSITITADADLTIQAKQGKLKLSGNGVEINSNAGVAIEASQNMDLKAGPQLNIQGSMVNIN